MLIYVRKHLLREKWRQANVTNITGAIYILNGSKKKSFYWLEIKSLVKKIILSLSTLS